MSSASGEVSSGRSGLSTTRPLPFNAALLALVGRVRFPRYSLRSSAPAFPSRAAFRLWEAANELRACFDEVAALAGRGGGLGEFVLRPAGRLGSGILGLQLRDLSPLQKMQVEGLRRRLLASCAVFDTIGEGEAATAESQRTRTSGGSSPNVGRSASRGGDRHAGAGRECTVDLTASDGEDDEQEDSASACAGLSSRPSLVMEHLLRARPPDATASAGTQTQTQEGDEKILSLLSLITIGTAACLVGYLHQQLAGERTWWGSFLAGSYLTCCPVLRVVLDGHLTQSLPFLNQLDAGELVVRVALLYCSSCCLD